MIGCSMPSSSVSRVVSAPMAVLSAVARSAVGGEYQGGAVGQRPGGDDADLVPRRLPVAAPALDLQHRLGDRVHAVQVAFGEQPPVRVQRQLPVERRRAGTEEVPGLTAAAEAEALEAHEDDAG